MQFVRVPDWQLAAKALADRLERELHAGRQVLWLVPGGSNLPACVRVMQLLDEPLTENLSLLLTDERYGLPGHRDSNYKQLLERGFEHKQATFIPPLIEGLTLSESVHRYAELAEHALQHATVVIGQFGIGKDGHIAGILPQSAAAQSTDMAAGYEAPPYTRLTLTIPALQRVQAAYVLVFGEPKRQALHQLEAENLSLVDQPAQLLKQLPEAYIFNDLFGESP